MEKISCSVAVLTFNSGTSLVRTLESVKEFAEIIICDGGSTDATLEIAKSYGCKIIFQDPRFKYENNKIRDFGGIRNQTLDASSYSWFLFLDSDELLSEKNVVEIAGIVKENAPAAYWVPRKYMLQGEIVDCAATYPTKQMRFFHRDSVNRFIKTIHERIEVKESARVLFLKSSMFVPMITDAKELRKKWNYYIQLECERRGDVTVLEWAMICLQNAKISALYLFRLIRNFFFCCGKKMPFVLEMERHVYHWNLCCAFFKKIRW